MNNLLQEQMVAEKARVEITDSLKALVTDAHNWDRGLTYQEIIKIFVKEAKKLDNI